MLINLIIRLFKKYIFLPHKHEYQFDKTIQSHTNACGMTAEGTKIIYKCTTCGKVIEVNN